MARSDVVAVAEHHRRGPALVQVIKRLGKLGWATSAVPAAETGTATVPEGPGHGGVMVAAAKHHCQPGLTKEFKEAVQLEEHQGLATQWVSRLVRAAGRDILFCAVYLAPGLGLEGTNITTLQELGAYVKVMGVEFVIGGDWNMLEAEEMAPLGMDNYLGAQWLTPEGDVPGGHRPIDRFLLSKAPALGSKVEWDVEGTWAQPHLGTGPHSWYERPATGHQNPEGPGGSRTRLWARPAM